MSMRVIDVYILMQAEEDKKPRADQQNLSKRRKKRRNDLKLSDDLCFICGKGGELVVCYNKTCPKGYHLGCLRLTKFPDGKYSSFMITQTERLLTEIEDRHTKTH